MSDNISNINLIAAINNPTDPMNRHQMQDTEHHEHARNKWAFLSSKSGQFD